MGINNNNYLTNINDFKNICYLYLRHENIHPLNRNFLLQLNIEDSIRIGYYNENNQLEGIIIQKDRFNKFIKNLINCYICIPITGREYDLKERVTKAENEVLNMGLNPILPPDINSSINNELNESIGELIGKDIQIIIDNCDYLYVCDGWENSKGCNTEIGCAEAYDKKIIYQSDIKKIISFI